MGRKKPRCYERIGIYGIDEVLAHTVFNGDVNAFIKANKIKKVYNDSRYWDLIEHEFDGHKVKMNSMRYQLFKTKGITCVECGIEGKYFALERAKGASRYHFNLYGFNKDGFEVMLTKDHIVPKSKGGKGHLGNFQTMCASCNAKKGNGDGKKKTTKIHTDTSDQIGIVTEEGRASIQAN